jgi:hypothetical protein
MSAGTITVRQECPGEPTKDSVVHERVYCQDCRWRGTVGDLLTADASDNDMLYCPKCRNYTWVWA